MLKLGASFRDYAIEAIDGRIGRARDFLFDDRNWSLRWFVVDTGAWLSARRALLHPSAILGVDHVDETLNVNVTRRQIEESPPLEKDQPVSLQMQDRLYGYYGWDPMWGGNPLGMTANPFALPPMPPRPLAQRSDHSSESGDPHLRSLAAVRGYDVQAWDAPIGHLQHFLIDDIAWDIRYLLVDTRNWWPGRHVLVSPHAVTAIEWAEQRIRLDITREQVRSSPPWEGGEDIDPGYEQRLHSHYRWPVHDWQEGDTHGEAAG